MSGFYRPRELVGIMYSANFEGRLTEIKNHAQFCPMRLAHLTLCLGANLPPLSVSTYIYIRLMSRSFGGLDVILCAHNPDRAHLLRPLFLEGP